MVPGRWTIVRFLQAGRRVYLSQTRYQVIKAFPSAIRYSAQQHDSLETSSARVQTSSPRVTVTGASVPLYLYWNSSLCHRHVSHAHDKHYGQWRAAGAWLKVWGVALPHCHTEWPCQLRSHAPRQPNVPNVSPTVNSAVYYTLQPRILDPTLVTSRVQSLSQVSP